MKIEFPLDMPATESHLPMLEIKSLDWHLTEAFKSFAPLKVLDKIGACLSIFIAYAYYHMALYVLHAMRQHYRYCDDVLEWAPSKTFENEKSFFHKRLRDAAEPGAGQQFLLKLGAFALLLVCLKLACMCSMVLVLLAFIGWSLYGVLYSLAPQSLRRRLDACPWARFGKHRIGSMVIDAMQHLRPFLNIGLYLSGPIGVLMMFWHWLCRLTGISHWVEGRSQTLSLSPVTARSGVLVLRQNLPVMSQREESFFDSPAFGLTIMAILLSGLPAYLSFLIYSGLGVDALFGHPLANAHKSFLRFFLETFYLGSIGCGLAVLFIKAWFTFPLNFTSTEYAITVDEEKIKKGSVRGWFADYMFWGFDSTYFASEMNWSDVAKIDFKKGMSFRLYPLPANLLGGGDSPLYRLLNRVAAFYDALSVPRISDEYLTVERLAGGSIKIKLHELSETERIEFLECIGQYAPQAQLTDAAREALVGSKSLADSCHTRLWFTLMGEALEGKNISTDRDSKKNPPFTLQDERYHVSKLMASGGQSTIYLAQDSHSQFDIVLKEFILTSGEGVEALLESTAEFEAESMILSRLDHEQIVGLKDMFIEDGRAYLAIDYVQGCSLRRLVQNEEYKFDAAQVLDLAEQMCTLLNYLHELTPPVVHRDFTPDNLILDESGVLRLVDFSISQIYKEGRVDECAGKHAYTPPEQYRGEATPQSDIYALGGTLYFLITGQDPEPVSTSILPQLPEAAPFESIVRRATAIELEDRYSSAAWLQVDLKSVKIAASC